MSRRSWLSPGRSSGGSGCEVGPRKSFRSGSDCRRENSCTRSYMAKAGGMRASPGTWSHGVAGGVEREAGAQVLKGVTQFARKMVLGPEAGE